MAELIATGTAQADSADFALTDGQSTTIFLKDAAGTTVPPLCNAAVQIKSADLEYFTVGTIDGLTPAKVLQAPGTYRVRKHASADAFGVDRI
jgi:hypothetical protein